MQIVPDMVANAAKRSPDRVCVSDGIRSHTFSETHDRAGRLASALLDHGLRPGDRVALLALNELEYTELQIGCQRAGLALVPLNFRLTVPELRFIVDDCSPGALVYGPGFAEHAEQLGVPRTWRLADHGFGDSYEQLVDSVGPPASSQPLAPHTACAVLYTSGTTGRPKGAVISNLAVWARSVSFGHELRVSPASRILQCMPMFHIASNLSYSHTIAGATSTIIKQPAPALIFDRISNDRPTTVIVVPTVISMMLDHPDVESVDFSSVEQMVYGGSSIAPSVLERAIDVMGCGFLQMYGMTETGGCSVLLPGEHDPIAHPGRLASAGTDAFGFELIVVDDQDRPLPPGEIGEIATRGPGVMTEYWDRPDATAEALRSGWMHTGDAAYRGDDGHLYITDRIKDMIVSGGENVYPREVEDVLVTHPGIGEAAVIGVPDERWGERVHAVVVLRDGASLDAQEIATFARDRLAAYKVPRSVSFAEALPRNPIGKVVKAELRAPFWEGTTRNVN